MKLEKLLHERAAKLGSSVDRHLEFSKITSDSRNVEAGTLFFAIRGSSTDGHQHIREAIKKGATAIIIDDPSFASAHTVLVDNSRKALASAASEWFKRPTEKFKLVGITGTNGKTTTSYLLEQVWKTLGKRTGLIGTVEMRIGESIESSNLTTPGPFDLQSLFARMRDGNVTHAVMEVSSIALDQYRTYGSNFEVGLLTNFSQDHLDYHGSMEKYLEAKARFFSEYRVPYSILNADDAASEKLARMATGRVLLYGQTENADFRLLELTTAKEGSTAVVDTPVGRLVLKTPLLGKYNIYNCLGVMAVAYVQGFSPKDAAKALETAVGAPGRLERVMFGERFPGIFVDYAHSDDALKNVLEVLAGFRKTGANRVVTVFGAGGDRDRLKRSKMGSVVSQYSDVTIVTSDNPRTENPQRILDDIESGIDTARTLYIREVDRRKAIHLALDWVQPVDLVLIAGKGHETYQIIGTEKRPFDDREVVREYYRGK